MILVTNKHQFWKLNMSVFIHLFGAAQFATNPFWRNCQKWSQSWNSLYPHQFNPFLACSNISYIVGRFTISRSSNIVFDLNKKNIFCIFQCSTILSIFFINFDSAFLSITYSSSKGWVSQNTSKFSHFSVAISACDSNSKGLYYLQTKKYKKVQKVFWS